MERRLDSCTRYTAYVSDQGTLEWFLLAFSNAVIIHEEKIKEGDLDM